MKEKPLPPLLQRYVDCLYLAQEPQAFERVYHAGETHVNHFGKLLKRGLVVNVVKGYEKDEPYTGPRMPKYVLTEKGRKHVSAHLKGPTTS